MKTVLGTSDLRFPKPRSLTRVVVIQPKTLGAVQWLRAVGIVYMGCLSDARSLPAPLYLAALCPLPLKAEVTLLCGSWWILSNTDLGKFFARTNGNKHYNLLCWTSSTWYCIMFLRNTIDGLFLFFADLCFTGIDKPQFVHLSVDGHLRCFHFWLVMLLTFLWVILCVQVFSE